MNVSVFISQLCVSEVQSSPLAECEPNTAVGDGGTVGRWSTCMGQGGGIQHCNHPHMCTYIHAVCTYLTIPGESLKTRRIQFVLQKHSHSMSQTMERAPNPCLETINALVEPTRDLLLV